MVIQVFLQHVVIFQIIRGPGKVSLALLDGTSTENEIKIGC